MLLALGVWVKWKRRYKLMSHWVSVTSRLQPKIKQAIEDGIAIRESLWKFEESMLTEAHF